MKMTAFSILFHSLFAFLMPTVVLAADTNSQEFKSAVELYRFWYPTVSMEGLMNGIREAGLKDSVHMFSAQTDANVVAFTANQDTPYGSGVIDLKNGPYVIEMPAGPFMALVNDHGQRWIADMGIPGQDAGKGGKYLIVPPGYKGETPQGYWVGKSDTNKVLVVVRIIPQNETQVEAEGKLKQIKIYPLSSLKNPKHVQVVSLTGTKGDMSLLKWENDIRYWEKLAKVINEEPERPKNRAMYDGLKKFGIEKGRVFKPNSENRELLTAASVEGKKEMLKVAFKATETPSRVRWSDRKWEWLILSSNPSWAYDHDSDSVARDRYFYQAIVMSPAMMKRDPTAGSLYWGAFSDAANKPLDGGKTYKLTVPLPVPARLFWSVSLYDTDTRSLISNGTQKSSLRSLAELADAKGLKSVDLYFAPAAPIGKEGHWIKTTPGKSWFAYFRIYGPEKGAFNNSWKPGDFTEVKVDTMAVTE